MTNLVQFATANKILLIPLTRIEANPFQHRVEYGNIGELADRIAAAHDAFAATMGLMQVPRGRVVDMDGQPVEFQKAAPLSERDTDWEGRGLKVQLMYGHRRWKAMQLLCERDKYPWNRGVMPVQITDAASRDMLLAVWEENERRQNLTAIEQAHLMAAAKLELGESASQREVAEFFGLARPTVANRMSLLDLPEEVQALNRTGQLSERQLLAMKPLYELVPIIEPNGRHWGSHPGDWQTCKPETYIRHIVEHPEKYTGDEIRGFSQSIEQAVGRKLPKILADHSFDPGMLGASDPEQSLSALGIEQATCKGCPFRRNSYCLKPDCLTAKKAAFGRKLGQSVAEELELPFSDKKEYFDSISYEERGLFRTSFEGGHRCEHLVIGWSDEWWGVRPFDASGRSSGEDHYQNRNGIMLGHAGKFKPGCIQEYVPEAEIENLADREMVDRWKKAAGKQERGIKDRVKQWFMDRFRGDSDVRRLMLSFMDNGRGMDGSEEQIDRALANYALSRVYSASDTFSYYQLLASRIEAAGLTPHAVLEYGRYGDGDTILKDAAVRVLAYWYEMRNRTWGNHAEVCRPEIERLIGLVSGRVIGDPELLELSAALDVAAQDVKLKLAKKESKEDEEE